MSISRTRACWAVVLCMSCALATRAAAQDTTFQPTFNVHGFLQIYYRAGDPLTKDGFRLRKSDLKFSGDVSPRLKWRVTFDAGKALGIDTKAVEVADSTAISEAAIDQKSKLLQDAALTYIVNKDFSIDVGQQVLPMTLEGKMSASQIETIERNLFTSERSRAIGLGDTRDIGVSANGFAFNTIEYHAGVFNEAGESAGTLDPNQQKTFMGRVAIHPSFLPALQIGGTAGYQGGARPIQRRRGGTEIQYRVPLFTLRAESMSARDGDLRRFGWYGLGALRPTDRVQLSARFDSWDRDLSGEESLINAYERQVVVGGSYAMDAVTKIVVNVVHQTFPNVDGIPSGTFLLTAFQATF